MVNNLSLLMNLMMSYSDWSNCPNFRFHSEILPKWIFSNSRLYLQSEWMPSFPKNFIRSSNAIFFFTFPSLLILNKFLLYHWWKFMFYLALYWPPIGTKLDLITFQNKRSNDAPYLFWSRVLFDWKMKSKFVTFCQWWFGTKTDLNVIEYCENKSSLIGIFPW